MYTYTYIRVHSFLGSRGLGLTAETGPRYQLKYGLKNVLIFVVIAAVLCAGQDSSRGLNK